MEQHRPGPPAAAPNPIDFQLRLAIRDRRLIGIRYQGGLRIVEPHDYGVQKGLERVLVYQLQSDPPQPRRTGRGWRLLEVAKISDCVVFEQQFAGSRGPQHRRRMTWEILYARVK